MFSIAERREVMVVKMIPNTAEGTEPKHAVLPKTTNVF